VKILENLFLKNLSFSKNSRKIWSGVLTPSGEVDFNLNRGGGYGRGCCREVPHGMILNQF